MQEVNKAAALGHGKTTTEAGDHLLDDGEKRKRRGDHQSKQSKAKKVSKKGAMRMPLKWV